MQIIQRTVYGLLNQLNLKLDLPPNILNNSSMNQKLGINSNLSLSSTDKPSTSYLGIGVGGHAINIGSNGNPPTFDIVPHRSTDASLYNQIPFVLRTTNNDLTLAEMANYRLRKQVTIDGVNYYAYYLKILDMTNVTPGIQYVAVNNGVKSYSPYTPTTDNLNPTPPTIVNGVVVTSPDYLEVSSILNITLSATEIQDILDACTIIFGTQNAAIISELALCSGVDKPVSITIGSTPHTITEAIGVQVESFMSSSFPLMNINTSLSINFGLGADEPLLVAP